MSAADAETAKAAGSAEGAAAAEIDDKKDAPEATAEAEPAKAPAAVTEDPKVTATCKSEAGKSLEVSVEDGVAAAAALVASASAASSISTSSGTAALAEGSTESRPEADGAVTKDADATEVKEPADATHVAPEVDGTTGKEATEPKESEPPSVNPASGSKRTTAKVKKQRWPKFPNLLEELCLKLTSTGIAVPESRKMMFARRREAREKGWLVVKDRPSDLDPALADKFDKKRKKRQQRKPGVLCNQVESDLFRAAFAGDCDLACEAIAAGADINVCTNSDYDGIGAGGSALHVAAARGHEGLVAVLLGAKADPYSMSGRKESALDLATRGGHSTVVQVLCSVGGVAPPDAQGVIQLMKQAPQHDHGRKRKDLRKAMDGTAPKALKRSAREARVGAWSTEPDLDDSHDNERFDGVKAEEQDETPSGDEEDDDRDLDTPVDKSNGKGDSRKGRKGKDKGKKGERKGKGKGKDRDKDKGRKGERKGRGKDEDQGKGDRQRSRRHSS